MHMIFELSWGFYFIEMIKYHQEAQPSRILLFFNLVILFLESTERIRNTIKYSYIQTYIYHYSVILDNQNCNQPKTQNMGKSK